MGADIHAWIQYQRWGYPGLKDREYRPGYDAAVLNLAGERDYVWFRFLGYPEGRGPRDSEMIRLVDPTPLQPTDLADELLWKYTDGARDQRSQWSGEVHYPDPQDPTKRTVNGNWHSGHKLDLQDLTTLWQGYQQYMGKLIQPIRNVEPALWVSLMTVLEAYGKRHVELVYWFDN